MLRIILLGRTGNNLFQYALGRVLAERHNVPLVLDASWFNRAGWSEVSHFLNLPINAKVVRRFSMGSRALRKLTGKHYWEYRGVPVLRENPADQSFHPQFLDTPSDCVLFGYFQTPRYFESISRELRLELNDLISQGAHASCVHASASCGSSLEAALSPPDSIAVHVRRGDYLQHPIFQVCDEAYYRQSMNRMREWVPGAHFFIFSDDPVWCRHAFTDADTTVVDSAQSGKNPLLDLHLMSLASHHIIANSTYSWWAAWLGEKSGQRVILPSRWYANDLIKAPIEEKRLPHWEVLDGR